MDQHLQHRARIAVGLLAIVLMAPNILILWQQWPDLRSASHLALPYGLLLILGWFSLFGRRIWLGCLLLSPFALLMPLDLYYVASYEQQPSAQAIAAFAATSWAEAGEFAGPYLIPLVSASILCLGIALWAAFITRRQRLCWQGRLRNCLFWIPVLLLTVRPAISLSQENLSGHSSPYRHHATRRNVDHAVSTVGRSYPFGGVVHLVQFLKYRHEMQVAVAKLAKYRFHAYLATPLIQRQIYVLVIGETSRRDHWQLFGYHRDTNPRLTKVKNLIPISHMVSAFTQTILALPVMLTRKPAKLPGTMVWPEASIVRAMHEAGFETWWISNQNAVGPNDSAIAVYAHEADHVRWLNKGRNYDTSLALSLRQAISQSTGNLFIVLHMMGSHEQYDHRYPHEYKHFMPTESDQHTTTPKWQRVTNSYDNTIVYTDAILATAIKTLADTGAPAALWYASDHGETLPSATCHQRSHGHENRPGYLIPALFWYSDAYFAHFPERVSTLLVNADLKTMSQDTFQSLIDMAGVDFPRHKKQSETWSLFSPKWQFHTRWVNQFYPIDFDHAQVQPPCQTLYSH